MHFSIITREMKEKLQADFEELGINGNVSLIIGKKT